MKCLVACLVSALDARTHTLLANVAVQLPSSLWHFLDIHNRFHESVISKRDLWNPHGAKEMSPFGRVCLFEGAIRVWAEYAGLK